MSEMKKLGFGMMRLPLTQPDDTTKIDFPQVCRMVDTFLEKGFTYFDTAYMYHNHNSERIVNEALVKRHPRDSFRLATKLPLGMMKGMEPSDMERIFQEQREKCGVDYFDYYLLHCLDKENYARAQEFDSFAFLQQKKAEGQIRKMGFSYHDNAELLDQILTEHPETEFVQLQINYLDWEDDMVQSRKCYEVCVRHQKPVIVMEPVKGGMLASIPDKAAELFKSHEPDVSVASWAVRFAASLDNVFMVLSGMSNEQQLQDNTAFMTDFKPLNNEELTVINQAVDIIHASIAVQCTACRYCTEGCPMKIAIPDYFTLYNRQLQFGDASRSRDRFRDLAGRSGKPSECIACGQCEDHCPQHLPIIENLKKAAELFEA